MRPRIGEFLGGCRRDRQLQIRRNVCGARSGIVRGDLRWKALQNASGVERIQGRKLTRRSASLGGHGAVGDCASALVTRRPVPSPKYGRRCGVVQPSLSSARGVLAAARLVIFRASKGERRRKVGPAPRSRPAPCSGRIGARVGELRGRCLGSSGFVLGPARCDQVHGASSAGPCCAAAGRAGSRSWMPRVGEAGFLLAVRVQIAGRSRAHGRCATVPKPSRLATHDSDGIHSAGCREVTAQRSSRRPSLIPP